MSENLKVEVRRSEWLRGEGDSSLLRGADSLMCCLGFAALAAGVPRESLLDEESPAGLGRNEIPASLSLLVKVHKIGGGHSNSLVCQGLMQINDKALVADSEREALLIEKGKEAGIDFSFVD